ncbi:MAG: hypothetical protein DRG59_09960 [Deltaproteobacteria bacterium]|nr:MAG: hypothetical protein DRG59_09960 [Deltaproteobacteria bacterium]
MKYLLKVTKVITLLSFLLTLTSLPTFAQNTAPVPTTFEILSPSDGNEPFLINQNYFSGSTQNTRIFYGGDFAPAAAGNTTKIAKGFHVWKDNNSNNSVDEGETKARGNSPNSRLTLGGTER